MSSFLILPAVGWYFHIPCLVTWCCLPLCIEHTSSHWGWPRPCDLIWLMGGLETWHEQVCFHGFICLPLCSTLRIACPKKLSFYPGPQNEDKGWKHGVESSPLKPGKSRWDQRTKTNLQSKVKRKKAWCYKSQTFGDCHVAKFQQKLNNVKFLCTFIKFNIVIWKWF